MNILKLLFAASVLSFVALPAMAQSSPEEGKGGSHHYFGGAKSEVPHHIGPKKQRTGSKKSGPKGSHHYSGGPREPHHIGPK
ncbi:MAG: hypothetical protein JHD07_02205 [Bradyrhizobium sp.]|jgi:hypothetical protein|uniref:hypothetical protein n=1 Tax=Bradyrhizobium sp. TaxID=376 RepID=UPI001A32B98C|nr:hypothetical protein [Bradyrhizobium sp.]MBJ7402160.1 hypothetical protein [Bradyrhizobium sp.]